MIEGACWKLRQLHTVNAVRIISGMSGRQPKHRELDAMNRALINYQLCA